MQAMFKQRLAQSTRTLAHEHTCAHTFTSHGTVTPLCCQITYDHKWCMCALLITHKAVKDNASLAPPQQAIQLT